MNTFKPRTRRPGLPAVVILLVLCAVACTQPSRQGSRTSEQKPTNGSAEAEIDVSSEDATSDSDDPCSQMFSNFFVAADSISYDNYEVVRLHKTIFDKVTRMEIPISYAILKSGGRTIATFDGVYFGARNQTAFGFASPLGGESKQLVVSQTIPRNGRHWIVDLSSDAATVFDSQEWDLGQEDVCIHDFDGDGIAELSMSIGPFCGIGAMAMFECPVIGVVFKYDPRARKYLPDGTAFARELDGIDEDAEEIDPAEEVPAGRTGTYLAKRLDIFLRYAYGGRENDGWTFFERAYKLPDKKETEGKIRAALQREPVYKFVYGNRPRVGS